MQILKTYLFLLLLTPLVSQAEINPEDLLTAGEAFVLETPEAVNGVLRLRWQAADGYYMYGEQFKVTSENPAVKFGALITPKGERKLDELFGEVEVHRDSIEIMVPYQFTGGAAPVEFQTRSQGCADLGVCYPPQKQKHSLSFAGNNSAQAMSAAPAAASTSSSLGARIGGLSEPELLTADQAFKLTPEVNGDTLIVRFVIAQDYYMYREHMKMVLDHPQLSLDQGSFPPGEWVEDPEFGQVEIYRSEVAGVYPIIGPAGDFDFTLLAEHQGCADQGLCYPPIKETFALNATLSGNNTFAASPDINSASAATSSSQAPQNKQDWFYQTLENGKLWQVSLATLAFGLLLAFTACMYPMIPILSGIIIGQEDKKNAVNPLSLSIVYVLSVALTFGVIGLITATIGGGIGIQAYFQSPWLLIPFTILFIALATSLFGFFDIQVPAGFQGRLQEFSNKQEGGNYWGVGVMGVFSALIIGPCGGPILIAALAYAAASSSAVSGFVALFFLGLGMGLPLLVIGAGGDRFMPKAGSWMIGIKAFGGVILLAVAILMLERMPGIFSPKLVMLLWSALLIISAFYLLTLDSATSSKSGWLKLARAIGLLIAIYGMLVMLGGITGGTRVTDPFNGSKLAGSGTNGATSSAPAFTYIKTRSDLDEQIVLANASGKSVMLDFYADWCTYCKKYDAYVFPDSRVQSALANTVMLKADVTETDSEDKELMKSLNVVLPPAIIFFNKSGDENKALRVVGEMSADEFYTHINQSL